MKGDLIKVVDRFGNTSSIQATVSGRNVTAAVEKESGINWLVVAEVTRGGTVVHEARYQVADVVMWEKRSA
jgi:hypothetical protein